MKALHHHAPRTPTELSRRIAEFVADEIREALNNHRGQVTLACRDLGISRQAFYRMARSFSLDLDYYRQLEWPDCADK